MFELERTVRFCINPDATAESLVEQRWNTFAGWPSMRGLGRYYELQIAVTGEPDELTGYMLNVSELDAAVRGHLLPMLVDAVHDDPSADPAEHLRPMFARLNAVLDTVELIRLRFQLTPYYAVTLERSDMSVFTITQQFDFAASHRLHQPALSCEENASLYGKCNNANGHGHNYRIEVTVATPFESDAASPGISLQAIEQIVHEYVITRFDHKHFNLDAEEFAQTVPSVEHITRVCFELLSGPIRENGGVLKQIRLWETDKTSCVYSGQSTPVPATT